MDGMTAAAPLPAAPLPNAPLPNAGPRPRRSGWIPWVFVGGMALVIAVNGVLIWAALSSFTGVTVGRAYDRGLAYNDVLAESARQRALGWRATLRLEEGVLALSAEDAEGRPLPGGVQGVLMRPLTGETVALRFVATAPGRFIAEANPPHPGQWEARLVLTGPGGRALDIRQRLVAGGSAR
ncbi:nitrogen fixation protein fixH [Pseudoroseomonas rhizosphaerae]|uniref:Nitrogen fixation protein fixH n=1 Tax=Teichococcus rhizosphaerae TaxID=1335062 RepID=A0A2C7AC30_9PROT|nr:FixH family protein [Pseudoroseomonas rhizosphaerae]PHK94646.1 nitrogen fixation protein fixH [Pseudoroseomonas rhizosphaerae]